jgi:hypothetical protein
MRGTRILAAGLLAAGIGIGAPACAAHAYYASGEPVHADDYARRAYDNGFRQGARHGQDDAQHHRDFQLDRDRDYRRGDDGYRREYGEHDFYRREFRRGYEAGYSDAFRRFERRR